MSRADRAPAGHEPSLLVHPVALLALALLVANDRVLKPVLHDWISGKLSDVAVCFFLPLFLAELGAPFARWLGDGKRRLQLGAVVTAVLFTVLELSTWCASAACDCLGALGPWIGIRGPFEMTRDPTDLLTLPMILLALAWGHARLASSPIDAGEGSP